MEVKSSTYYCDTCKGKLGDKAGPAISFVGKDISVFINNKLESRLPVDRLDFCCDGCLINYVGGFIRKQEQDKTQVITKGGISGFSGTRGEMIH